MSGLDLERLAELARGRYYSAIGEVAVAWPLLSPTMQQAWRSAIEVVVDEVARRQQRERLQLAEVERT